MGQDQPRIIIGITLVIGAYTMLQAKFKAIGHLVPEKKIFFRFLPYMGVGAMLVMCPSRFEQFFVPATSEGYMWNLVTIGPVLSEERSSEIVDGLEDGNGQHSLPILKLPRVS